MAEKTVKKATTKKTSKNTAEKAKVTAVKPKKSVLMVASEANPFIGTGGLADVLGSLPISLCENGNYDVRVILPLYGDMEEGYRSHLTFLGNFNVELAWRNQYCGLFYYKRKNVTFYFVDNEYYFKRKGLYGFFDDGERFAFFSKAVIDSLGFLNYYPDVLHAHDWQTALSVIYLKTLYKNSFGYDRIKSIFTIHNIEYQGKYDKMLLGDLFGLGTDVEYLLEYDGCLNLMKGAIELSDFVNTVSPTYAEEIKHEFYAHGLQYAINANAHKISGILNGIDVNLFNSETNESLFAPFSVDNLDGKKVCKKELQKLLGLPERDVPIIAIISRLVSHKGLDLVKHVLEDVLCEDVQVVILGKGETYYESYFSYIADKYQGKCRAIIAYNRDLSTKIYSGSDIFLMPSKQEPCGLSQMIAARYGSIPVVRSTGGLKDSITPFNDENRSSGIGFVFNEYNADEMLYVLKDAIFTYGNKPVWEALIKRAMQADFTWTKSAKNYEKLYDLCK
ncbi:MAG: glycogen synthase [Clostridia bacterium]|nr:glycogen synthase [Clostridia bacterium]